MGYCFKLGSTKAEPLRDSGTLRKRGLQEAEWGRRRFWKVGEHSPSSGAKAKASPAVKGHNIDMVMVQTYRRESQFPENNWTRKNIPLNMNHFKDGL